MLISSLEVDHSLAGVLFRLFQVVVDSIDDGTLGDHQIVKLLVEGR
jgi:hypothetical protein